METHSSVEPGMNDNGGEHYLGTWTRIYLHGVIAFVVFYVLAYVVTRLVPIFEFTGSRALAIGLSILAIVVVPPLVGSLILFGLFPLLGMKEGWRSLAAWDDRLFSQLSSARQKVQVVIINWPNKEVRTMGVLTATFTADRADRQLAAVYVPTAPHTRYGYIRVVSVDEVEFTDLTLREWQLYQLTFGSVSPDRIRSSSDED
jgi:hypothetical protein